MQILYYVLMCFSFGFYFVQRIRHGCVGKQMLQWYLRHFAATWEGECRSRQGGDWRQHCLRGQSSVCHSVWLHQEFNGS